MNLEKLFATQKKLDDRINEIHPAQERENRLTKKVLAFIVEVSELANEWRGFKFWSNNQEPTNQPYFRGIRGRASLLTINWHRAR